MKITFKYIWSARIKKRKSGGELACTNLFRQAANGVKELIKKIPHINRDNPERNLTLIHPRATGERPR